MKDRVSKHPGRVKLVPVDEVRGIYDMLRADDPTQTGDPLCKNTFLRDETAKLFGLDFSAVPADVLDKIIKGFAMKGDFSVEKNFPKIFLKNTSNNRTAEVNAGGDAIVSLYNRSSNGGYTSLHLQSEATNLKSALRFAHKPDGNTDAKGYDVLHTGNLEALGSARVETGTYEGTGSPGSESKPISLTFTFKPKLLFITDAAAESIAVGNYSGLFFVFNLPTAFRPSGWWQVNDSDPSTLYHYAKADGNTVSWYGKYTSDNSYPAAQAFNGSGRTYNYLAIG